LKIVGIIPARYKSSRFEGKPLADIYGKPMIWWVYNQAKKVKEIDEVYVATDDERIEKICKQLKINVVMTSDKHKTPLDRIQEFSDIIHADLYVYINGDEPLIEPEVIKKIIPEINNFNDEYVANLITQIKNELDAADPTNIKVVTDDDNFGIYMSRSPIPYPKGVPTPIYRKYVGIGASTKKMLDYYINTKRHSAEISEDTDLLRFMLTGKKVKFIDVDSDTISVDTQKDLIAVRELIQNKINKGEIKL